MTVRQLKNSILKDEPACELLKKIKAFIDKSYILID